ncbi:hypothetical protein BMYO_2093 [Bifidobacterium myosotis]|uniref:Uncharacterized protein n=1 Tax=Bifidobacterium myosotis TaxID=1630166 RepID=A0A261FD75_9BIFI|nr:hypothetical protein [Bifidobacterium myosotis]OZG57110.1 hypothetical protein BMYO_2093 [Bifidobacterium myosotis]
MKKDLNAKLSRGALRTLDAFSGAMKGAGRLIPPPSPGSACGLHGFVTSVAVNQLTLDCRGGDMAM